MFFFLLYFLFLFFFFFFSSRRRHTRSLRDWSSDVCSSDLCLTIVWRRTFGKHHLRRQCTNSCANCETLYEFSTVHRSMPSSVLLTFFREQIGRASCRERV